MTKFEICEVLDKTQQFIVCFTNDRGDKHEVAIDFPDTELSDESLLSYIAQFAPRSITKARLPEGRYDHLQGAHEISGSSQTIANRPQLLRMD